MPDKFHSQDFSPLPTTAPLLPRMRDSNLPGVDAFLSAFLRGENPHWPQSGVDEFAATFLVRGKYHGVLPLIHDRLQRVPDSARGWPQPVVLACREIAIEQAMWELRHQDLLRHVLVQLTMIDVRPVLFKGTALAYCLYPVGALRPRGDADLIIAPDMLTQVSAVLEAIGFRHVSGVVGEFNGYEADFEYQEAGGTTHLLDVHWRINNSELLSKLFSYHELLQRAQPIPALGPDALAAGAVDALLIACMHRATHKQNPYYVDGIAYYSGDRLIWLYDIHLLLGSLLPAQYDEFVSLAVAKGLRTVCLEGIECARACFHTPVPSNVTEALAASTTREPIWRYLNGGQFLQMWMDFRAYGSVANQVRYLKILCLPPARYMRLKYPEAQLEWLPWLYLRRAVGGLMKRIRWAPR